MRRAGVILLILFQAAFLNIVVPGHLRGMVTTTGRSASSGVGDLVCGGCCQKAPAKAPEKLPSPEDRANCAICFLAAHLLTPPVIDVRLTELGPLNFVHDVTVQGIEPIAFIHTYDACGPPATI